MRHAHASSSHSCDRKKLHRPRRRNGLRHPGLQRQQPRTPASFCADGDAIVIPAICDEHGPQVDFEGELAVIIGRTCKDVPESEAFTVIGGYAAANDVTARWWQREGGGGQFCRGKGFDTFCPMSAMTPASAVPDPQALRIVTRVNGVVMQDSSTSLMIHSVARIVAELSRGTTLLAGTVIITGTPSGVGFGRSPKVFLQAGDVVEVEIAGVGRTRNPVQHA
ncbi:MAG: fumarylacetoacetate hydrolase family protein [Planctomycetes bacterium]|nr:fumarylacetoacetate hydrolase family protein [Planctomycetota bacterium]